MALNLSAKQSPFDSVQDAVTESGEYRPVSFWQETVDVVPGAPLDENLSCDVAIVGGGFTGLSTAYEVKRAAPNLDVVLIERSVIGHGASGRNGGFAMPLIGWDLTGAARSLGEDTAREAYKLMYRAVDHLKRIVKEHRIDCDMEETGYLLLATSPKRLPRVKHEVALSDRLGFDLEFLEGDALHEHIKSDAFLAGAFDPHPAVVNPAKLARGLKAVVEEQGVRIFEQTPLEKLEDGAPATLTTPGGVIRAKTVVLAVNGYNGSLGFMDARILPVHTYIVLTEPLSDSDLESTGWHKKRASLETARNLIHYFRLTADNRIVFGGEDVDLFVGGRYQDTHPRIFEALKKRFREYFPTLNHVDFSHEWGGVLGVTLDMFPTFGINGAHNTIFHAAGYSGHGVSLANYAGVILAPMVLDQLGLTENSGKRIVPFFMGRKPFAVPPDPLRYIGLQAYRSALRAQDWWQGA